VSEIFSPLSGEVVAVNERLADTPELVNSGPYGDGWMLELRVADGEQPELLDAAAYAAHTG
jgi:glycine cleavage system H protein